MELKKFSLEEGEEIGKKLGIVWDKFDAGQFTDGINTELQKTSGKRGDGVSDDELLEAGKTALANLNETPDYYLTLQRKEMEAKGYYDKN